MVNPSGKSKLQQSGRSKRKPGSRAETMAGCLLALVFSLTVSLFAQQPQAQSGQPIYPVNAKYVNGVAPGYWPTPGSGLTLNISAGTAFCGNPPAAVHYVGGTLVLIASQTNYVYLDPALSCAPSSNTTGFTFGQIPIARVVAGESAITSVTDVRMPFVPQPIGTDATGKAVTPYLNNFRFADQFSGADIGAKVNAAISSCAASGCKVIVPSGEYSFSTTINVNKANVELSGQSSYSSAANPRGAGTELAYSGSGSAIVVSAAGSLLKNFSLQYPAVAGPAILYQNGTGGRGTAMRFVRVYGTNRTGTAIQVGESSPTGVYSMNLFEVYTHSFAVGLRLYGNTHNLSVRDSAFNEGGVGVQVGTLNTSTGSNILFDGVQIERNTDCGFRVIRANSWALKHFYIEHIGAAPDTANTRAVCLDGDPTWTPLTGVIEDGYIAVPGTTQPDYEIRIERAAGVAIRRVDFTSIPGAGFIENLGTNVYGLSLEGNHYGQCAGGCTENQIISSRAGLIENADWDGSGTFHALANGRPISWYDNTGARRAGIYLDSNNNLLLNPSGVGRTLLGYGATPTGAALDELVFPNGRWLRGTNAAGNNAYALISLDGSDRTAVDGSGRSTVFGSGAVRQFDATGKLTPGGGTAIVQHLSATYSLNLAAPGAVPGCVDSPAQTLTGAALGDTVVPSLSVALQSAQVLAGFVNATNQVTFRVCQFSGTAADPDGSGATYRADLWKH